MPFWFSVILGIGIVIYFRKFYEVIPYFFLVDLLYGTHEMKFWGSTYVSVVLIVIVFFIIETVKEKMRIEKYF